MKKFAPRNGATRSSRQRGANCAGQIAGETAFSGRDLCEEFAPRNGRTRASGERGANRARGKPAGPGRPKSDPPHIK